ncbi:MAG: hypothetical protein E7302_07350 [Butyrivibrio sp.]|nr:hypothetical protein [Butyrivibrio sp.]
MNYKQKNALLKIIDGVVSPILFILSFVLLYVPSWRMNLWGYFIVFVSALCFAIGYFRTIALIPRPKTKTGWFLYRACLACIGSLMQILGLYYMYITESDQGICSAVVIMIESLAMFLNVIDWDNTAHTNFATIVCRIATVFFIVFSIWLLIRDHFAMGSVYVATILFVECFAIGIVTTNSLSLPWKKTKDKKQ